MLNIDKPKWNNPPKFTVSDVAKMVEASYREFVVVTGNKDFKLFADNSFKYLITASTGRKDIHTYLTNLGYKLIVKENSEGVCECSVTNHFDYAYINFKEV